MLSISSFTVSIGETAVLHGVDLAVQAGTIHALMGPNGSGKSSLAAALLGHPAYQVTGGTVQWQGTDLIALQPHDRARAGLFLAFQHPFAVPGVRVTTLLREACRAQQGAAFNEAAFLQELSQAAAVLEINAALLERGLNDGFSGGEKKRFELLQMLMLKPQLAILDEIDSGLDIDALKLVGKAVTYARIQNPSVSLLIITHYQRLLQYIVPDHVHIMVGGRVVASGNTELVTQLEARGYDGYTTR